MKSLKFLLTSSILLIPRLGIAEIGIQTAWNCLNESGLRIEVQTVPAHDSKETNNPITFLGVEVGGSSRNSILVTSEKDVSGGRQYQGHTGTLTIGKGSAGSAIRKAEAAVQGIGNRIQLICHPPVTVVCGQVLVTPGTNSIRLATPNHFFPKEEKLITFYDLSASNPDVLAPLKKDKFFCVEGTVQGTKESSVSVLKVVNKSPISM